MLPRMMKHLSVTLQLPLDLIELIDAQARSEEIPPAEVMRRALRAALAPEPSFDLINRAAMSPEDAALQSALSVASGWLDLQNRLGQAGYVLRLGVAGDLGRLALHDRTSLQFLTALDEIGPTMDDLALRFRAPFPGIAAQPGARPPQTPRILPAWLRGRRDSA
ncbi:ribbon-helix-helix protein, CopG family [Thioclava sp. BHET1]|nr:ribbon-helix-helix protein, CopG family [Thioclava sp. BHET1]